MRVSRLALHSAGPDCPARGLHSLCPGHSPPCRPMVCSVVTAFIRILALVFPTTRAPRDETKNTPTPTRAQCGRHWGCLPQLPARGRRCQRCRRVGRAKRGRAAIPCIHRLPSAGWGGMNQPNSSSNLRGAGSEQMRGRLSAVGKGPGEAPQGSECGFSPTASHNSACELTRFSYVRLFATLWSPPGSSVHRILQARTLQWAHVSNWLYLAVNGASQVALAVKNLPANAGDLRRGFNPWVEIS